MRMSARTPKFPLHFNGLAALLVFGALALPETAAASATLWTNNCSGCHGSSPSGNRKNAADRKEVIDAAISSSSTGMGGLSGLTSAERTSLATYIESILNTSPAAISFTYPTSSDSVDLSPDIVMGTGVSAFNVLETVTGPSAGTVSYTTSFPPTVTFNRGSANAGSYSFTYRARNSTTSLVSSTRTVNVTIAKANQTITFNAQTTSSRTYAPSGTFAISPTASATSGLSVTYSSTTTSVCTVSGTTVTMVGAGTCTIAANQSGNTNYNAASQVTQSVTITKASQTITFGAQTSPRTYSAGGSFAISPTATTSSGLSVTHSSTTTGVCTVSGTTVTIVSAGTCTLAANQAGNTNYNAASQVTQNVTINKATQTLTFNAQTTPRTYSSGGTFSISPTATSNDPSATVTHSSTTTGICTTSGNTVTMVAAGTCTLAANAAATTNFNAAAQVTQNVTINGTVPGAPTLGTITSGDAQASIAFTAPSNNGGSAIASYTATCAAGGQSTRTASGAGSPLVVTSLTNGVTYSCSVTATNSTGTSAASASGNANPTPMPVAPSFTSASSTTFTVGTLGSFTVTASGVPNPTFSTASPLPSGVTLSANGSLSGTPALGTVGSYVLNPLVATNSAGTANQTFTLTVAKASQSITFAAQTTGSRVFGPSGTFAISPTATSSSGLAVAYSSTTTAVCTVSGTTVTIVAVGTCTIAATQAGDGNYNAASQVTQSVTITQASQTITFDEQSPASRAFSNGGTFSINPAATASSGLAIAYSSGTAGVCTVSGTTVTMVSVGNCVIQANQAGNANYTAATQVTQDVDIVQGNQTITFAAQAAQNYSPGGTFSINPLATATSGLTITYSSLTTAVCTITGSTVTIVTIGTCTIAADQAGDANFTAAPQVTRDITINATVPGAPTIGTATPGNGQAMIEFTAPTNDGGRPITSYTATCNPAAITGTDTDSPVTVIGLTNGTAYTCSVKATNSVGSSVASGTVEVTPAGLSGAQLWANTCSGCHGPTPQGARFNAAGTTSAVLEYVRVNQPLMAANSGVQALSPSDLAVIAQYIAGFVPANNQVVAQNTAKAISVSRHITLNTFSFTSVEVVTEPANGVLSAFTGTTATYTPNPGFTGSDSFTYRGKLTSPELVVGDTFTVNINVSANAVTLTVALAGTGSGSVSSSPSGISCGSTCSEIYDSGTSITLTAVEGGDTVFAGWSGITCSGGNGASPCTFTLNSTVTATATFNTTVGAKTDFNDDGLSDTLLENTNGALYVWHLDGGAISGGNVPIISSGNLPQLTGGWTILGRSADFDGDGKADLLLYNTGSGALYVWMIDGTNIVNDYLSIPTSGNLPGMSGGWGVAGTGDFNGDGKSDILLKNVNGALYVWMIDGADTSGGNVAITSNGNLPQLPSGWDFAATGDFNGDGKSDILLKHTNGALYVWMLDGTNISGGYVTISSNGDLPQLPAGWDFAFTGDFNGDGKSDILLKHTNGALYVWMLDGTQFSGSYVAITSSGDLPQLTGGWDLATTGDYNGDGKTDIMLMNANGALYVWMIDGAQFSGSYVSIPSSGNLPVLPAGWSIKALK